MIKIWYYQILRQRQNVFNSYLTHSQPSVWASSSFSCLPLWWLLRLDDNKDAQQKWKYRYRFWTLCLSFTHEAANTRPRQLMLDCLKRVLTLHMLMLMMHTCHPFTVSFKLSLGYHSNSEIWKVLSNSVNIQCLFTYTSALQEFIKWSLFYLPFSCALWLKFSWV